MNLIVGATGMLGSEICRLPAQPGTSVRALARDTSNPEKAERLRGLRDVARFAAAAAGNPQAGKAVIKLGGPDALSPLDVVRLA